MKTKTKITSTYENEPENASSRCGYVRPFRATSSLKEEVHQYFKEAAEGTRRPTVVYYSTRRTKRPVSNRTEPNRSPDPTFPNPHSKNLSFSHTRKAPQYKRQFFSPFRRLSDQRTAVLELGTHSVVLIIQRPLSWSDT